MVLSIYDAKKVLSHDNVEGNQRFADKNIPQVITCCNLWFAVCEDCGFDAVEIMTLRNLLLTHGLTAVCGWMSDFAESLLSCHEEFMGPNFDLHTVVEPLEAPDSAFVWLMLRFGNRMIIESPTNVAYMVILQVCLFLERFTFKEGDPAASIKKFVEVNAKCRSYEYDWSIWPGPTILGVVSEEMDYILSGDFSVNVDDAGFTNGSTNSTRADYLAKWQVLSHIYPNYKGAVEYPLPGGFSGRRLNKYPVLMGVPKTFKAYRIIAPEDPVINYWGTACLMALRRSLAMSGNADFISEHDQGVNQALAALGSLEKEWATIDMSSASDSISKAMFFAVCPLRLRALFAEYSSTWVKLPSGADKKLFTFLTSGHPLTWLTEAVYFLALARTGVRLCGYEGYRSLCFAYGDDLIVPADAFETVKELLELFGHKVNGRKSFAYGAFRESCGGWFLDGYDITPIHWPRRAVGPQSYDLALALVNIQHHAWVHRIPFTQTIRMCEALAVELEPHMTYSSAYTECTDLWDGDLDPMASDASPHWGVETELHDRKRSEFLDHLVYYQYLQYGPLYYDGLSELLGISTSRFSVYRTKGKTMSVLRPV